MPVFTLQAPDGRKVRIEAADQATAMRGAQEWYASQGRAKPARKSGVLDQIGAFAQAASEQIPFLDEAAAGTVALATGRPYAEVRKVGREMAAEDRRERPTARNAGGIAGFGATLAAPGGAYLKGAKTLPQAARRGAAIGAAYGAVQGAATAPDGLANRARGTVSGAAVGAATGAALPAAMKVGGAAARRVGAGAREAGSRVVQTFGKRPGEAAVTPKATERAEEIVADMARRKGLTAEQLAQDAALTGGKPVTGAELLGREAMTQLTAIARRSGQTGDALDETLRGRADDAGQRIVDDFGSASGIDPATVADDFAAMTDALRRKASPAYDAAYEGSVEMTPALAELMRRPSVRAAMQRAYAIAREEGANPEELGLRWQNIVDDADLNFAGPAPDAPSPVVRRAMADIEAGRARGGPADNRLTLSQYLARGGLADDGGELSAMDLVRRFTTRGGAGRFASGKGMSLDDAALAAQEAGYFPELPVDSGRLSPQQLLNALREEAAGRAVRRADVGAASARQSALDEAAERLYRHGADGTPHFDEAAYAGGPADPSELVPVYSERPTMRAWDYIKRGMDDVLEGYRDSTTRRLNLDTQGRAVVGTQSQLRNELVTQNPAYGEALNKGGEPLRLEQAWRDFPKLMGNSVPDSVFNQRWATLTDAEKQAALGGFANNLLEKARAGRLRAREFKAPAFKAKLRTVMGGQADAFLQALEQEMRLARGQRMAPGTNSVTAEVLDANREMDRGVGFMAELQRRADLGQNPIQSIAGAGATAIASPFAGFVRGVQAPYGQAVRNELGRILMDPEATLNVLRNAAAGRPAYRPNALLPYTPAISGQVARDR
jgi:hypothetical protein